MAADRPETQAIREAELTTRLRPVIAGLPASDWRLGLDAALRRQPHSGEDTLAGLSDRVRLEIDEVMACGPNGLALMGWLLAKPNALRDVRIRCGSRIVPLDLGGAIRIDRPDVLEAVGKDGYDTLRCGFIAFAAGAVEPNERAYIEVRTSNLAVGYRNLPAPKRTGVAAMKHLLASFELRYGDLPPAFDRVVGPAVRLINQDRLASKPRPTVIDYGPPNRNPTHSVVIPLYGRIDFAEYQLGLFSGHRGNSRAEFIFVLDDPARRDEAQRLWASLQARFGLSCRLVLLPENLGYAPANNVGLRLARGQYVVFLNSDVFPGTPDWLDRLAAALEADPGTGAVAPLLLFEDGAVQHQGLTFRRLPEFGDWWFCHSVNKGRKFAGPGGVSTWPAVTGACMMMRRSLAEDMGGFDESYAIGDFEDADLCLRLQAQGLTCAVESDVRLYHLERKSQQSSALRWRMNLTLYNAWLFRRAGPTPPPRPRHGTRPGLPRRKGHGHEQAAVAHQPRRAPCRRRCRPAGGPDGAAGCSDPRRHRRSQPSRSDQRRRRDRRVRALQGAQRAGRFRGVVSGLRPHAERGTPRRGADPALFRARVHLSPRGIRLVQVRQPRSALSRRDSSNCWPRLPPTSCTSTTMPISASRFSTTSAAPCPGARSC